MRAPQYITQVDILRLGGDHAGALVHRVRAAAVLASGGKTVAACAAPSACLPLRSDARLASHNMAIEARGGRREEEASRQPRDVKSTRPSPTPADPSRPAKPRPPLRARRRAGRQTSDPPPARRPDAPRTSPLPLRRHRFAAEP